MYYSIVTFFMTNAENIGESISHRYTYSLYIRLFQMFVDGVP